MKQTTEPPVNRMYKSRIFAMLYQEKKELLDLYNAISGKHYEDPELLEINTLENAIYMTMKMICHFLSISSFPVRASVYLQSKPALA